MEKTIKKLLIATGVVISGFIALTPLTSYATNAPGSYFGCVRYGDTDADKVECPDPASDRGNTVVNLNVDTILELDVVSKNIQIAAETSRIASGELSATVRSSREYNILLSAEQPNLIHNVDNNYAIPAASNLEAGTNGWGIKKDGAEGYTAVTKDPQVFYEGDSAMDSRQTDLEIGVATSPSLPAGTYSTIVTVTAATKN